MVEPVVVLSRAGELRWPPDISVTDVTESGLMTIMKSLSVTLTRNELGMTWIFVNPPCSRSFFTRLCMDC